MAALLEVTGLAKDFDGVQVLAGVDLVLGEGELLCLIGPNGCGKTTLFNLLTGVLRPSGGAMRFAGHDLAGRRPQAIARQGIGRKFQVPRIFADLSVAENMTVPLLAGPAGAGPLALLSLGADRVRVDGLLARVRLAGRRETPAGQLSHGEKQWLEIAMVAAQSPRLMLLDEPTAGMTGAETAATAGLIRDLQRVTGIAAIVIEHDMGFVRTLGCPVAVMLRGRVHLRGTYDQIAADPEVRAAYLGTAA